MNQPKREKAKKTKQDIIEAAWKLFTKKGVLNTSVSEIVREAHVAKGTFYLYFETKDDVLSAIIEHNVMPFERILADLQSHPVSRKICDAAVERLMAAMKDNYAVMKLMHEARFLSHVTHNLTREYPLPAIQAAIEAWLDKSVSQGVIDIPDTRFIARYIYQSFHAMMDSVIIENAFTLDKLSENLKFILKRILNL
jgi:AcrR family transcriptional regulator